jgi:hypothetical protein
VGPATVLIQPAVKGRHTADRAHGRWSAVSNETHGREGPHPGERQTPKSLYSAVHALKHTADTLPCPAVMGTWQTTSAIAVTAVTTLPCACTRQMVCRVQKQHYRVYGRHVRGMDSGSVRTPDARLVLRPAQVSTLLSIFFFFFLFLLFNFRFKKQF